MRFMAVDLIDLLLRKTGLERKLQRLPFADAKDDSTRDLKSVEGLAGGHHPSRDPGHITKGRFVMTDLIPHIEPEGQPLGEEVLHTASKVPVECGLAAVGTGVHQIYIRLSGLPVVAERNFVETS